MPIPGPKVSVILQERTDTTGSDLDTSASFAAVKTINAVFAPLSAEEQVLFDKQTTFSIHRLMFAFDTLGSSNAAKLIEKNRFVISSTNYDIIGVQDFDAGVICRHYEVRLKLVTT